MYNTIYKAPIMQGAPSSQILLEKKSGLGSERAFTFI